MTSKATFLLRSKRKREAVTIPNAVLAENSDVEDNALTNEDSSYSSKNSAKSKNILSVKSSTRTKNETIISTDNNATKPPNSRPNTEIFSSIKDKSDIHRDLTTPVKKPKISKDTAVSYDDKKSSHNVMNRIKLASEVGNKKESLVNKGNEFSTAEPLLPKPSSTIICSPSSKNINEETFIPNDISSKKTDDSLAPEKNLQSKNKCELPNLNYSHLSSKSLSMSQGISAVSNQSNKFGPVNHPKPCQNSSKDLLDEKSPSVEVNVDPLCSNVNPVKPSASKELPLKKQPANIVSLSELLMDKKNLCTITGTTVAISHTFK